MSTEITIDAAIDDWDAPAGYLQCRSCRVIREGEGNADSVIPRLQALRVRRFGLADLHARSGWHERHLHGRRHPRS